MDLSSELNILKTQLNAIHDQVFSESLTLESCNILIDELNTLNDVLIEVKEREANQNMFKAINIAYKLSFLVALTLAGILLISNPSLSIIEILIALLLKKGINKNKKENEIFDQNMKELESLLKDVEYKQDITQKRRKLLEKKIELQNHTYIGEKAISPEIPKVPHISQARVLRLQKK